MNPKIKEKERALQLRKQGYSLNEISNTLSVSKSSASLWVRDVSLSPHAKAVIAKKRIRAREKAAATVKIRVDKSFSLARRRGDVIVASAVFNEDASRVLCALIYWCEGVKIRRRGLFGFTNSDPLLVASFLNLLRQGFSIDEEKFRVMVHLHDYHDEKTQLRFWSKVTSIPLVQFHKPYRKPHTGTRTRDGYQGCVSIRYMNVRLGREIEGIAKAFLDLKGPIG